MSQNWAGGEAARKQLGTYGVWFGELSLHPWALARDVAQRVEAAGYSTLWVNEGLGSRDPLTHAALVLGTTAALGVAAGIANIYVRDAVAARDGAYSLAEAYPGRFTLGLGVSHKPLVDTRGHASDRPLATMGRYLEGLDALPYNAAVPEAKPPVVIAALRERMLALAAEKATGAHPYLVPVPHTARAREILGPDPILAPEVTVVLEGDADRARARARRFLEPYLGLPNYLASFRALGFEDADFAGGGSDALVDTLVVWGEPDEVVTVIDAHRAAGADHVAIQVAGVPVGEAIVEHEHLASLLMG